MKEFIDFNAYEYTYILYLVSYKTIKDTASFILAKKTPIIFNPAEEKSGIKVIITKNSEKTYKLLGVIQRNSKEEITDCLERYGNEKGLSVVYEHDDGFYLIQTLNIINAFNTRPCNDLIAHQIPINGVEPEPLRHVKVEEKEEESNKDESLDFGITIEEIRKIVCSENFIRRARENYACLIRSFNTCHRPVDLLFNSFYITFCDMVISSPEYLKRLKYLRLDTKYCDFVCSDNLEVIDVINNNETLEDLRKKHKMTFYNMYRTYESLSFIISLYCEFNEKFNSCCR